MQEKRLLWEPVALLALCFVGWGNLLGGAIDPPHLMATGNGTTPPPPHLIGEVKPLLADALRIKFTFCH